MCHVELIGMKETKRDCLLSQSAAGLRAVPVSDHEARLLPVAPIGCDGRVVGAAEPDYFCQPSR